MTLVSARQGYGRCREKPPASPSHTLVAAGGRGRGLGQTLGRQVTMTSLILQLRDPRGRFPDSAPRNVLPATARPRESPGGCKGLGPLRTQRAQDLHRARKGADAGKAAQGGPSGLVPSSARGPVHPVLGMGRDLALGGAGQGRPRHDLEGRGVLQAVLRHGAGYKKPSRAAAGCWRDFVWDVFCSFSRSSQPGVSYFNPQIPFHGPLP